MQFPLGNCIFFTMIANPDQRKPFISIITLNYNSGNLTKRFLESARALQWPSYEILVCDMASSENILDHIDPKNYPYTRILVSEKNLGFAAGNNWGMAQAKGEYFFIVNNDTILTPDILNHLWEPFIKYPRVAVCCPLILKYPEKDVIEYAGFNPMNFYTGRTSSIGYGEKDDPVYHVERETFGAHGCAMLVSKSVLALTGMFPEKFFLYYEEWDLSMRILKQGFNIWYCGVAKIYHQQSGSVGKKNPLATYYLSRNRILFMRRNSNPVQYLGFVVFFGLFSLPKTVLGHLIKGRKEELRAFLKAIGWNFFNSKGSSLGNITA